MFLLVFFLKLPRGLFLFVVTPPPNSQIVLVALLSSTSSLLPDFFFFYLRAVASFHPPRIGALVAVLFRIEFMHPFLDVIAALRHPSASQSGLHRSFSETLGPHCYHFYIEEFSCFYFSSRLPITCAPIFLLPATGEPAFFP